ncbi:RNase adapter RapZ [Litorivicinus lipolyticus]|uniref:RNase adapter RapZ n=1 Tax=Litorivicinus lipolyticus TaxID=418701 RepID=UPI001FE31513|nr:RNase adapter RapZ [Litorivicinus lipolyticus]
MSLRLVVVSGRSGSGKSAALGALEDAGYTCIDNLPVGVLLPTLRLLEQRDQAQPVAVGIDARGRAEDLAALPNVLSGMAELGIESSIVWLDANTSTLINRFHATRRRHPLLTASGSLEKALEAELRLLDPIVQHADRHMDTTRLSLHDLRAGILQVADPDHQPGRPEVHVLSFGFKHGVPDTIDFVFDARFLPNPFWEPVLRPFNGTDPAVIEFLSARPESLEYLSDLGALLLRWVPNIIATGRPNVTVAIGCTGGQHRSVFLAEQLKTRLADSFDVSVRHRELSRD